LIVNGALPAMKAVILAGGYGTRISEESGVRPKPMVEIGGQPILWHIMKIYSAHGLNDFNLVKKEQRRDADNVYGKLPP
jgi:NDP-sugar pyrophosphorylase family protein